jgi:hypothetical protein
MRPDRLGGYDNIAEMMRYTGKGEAFTIEIEGFFEDSADSTCA